MREWHGILASATAVLGVACSDPTSGLDQTTDAALDLSAAYTTVPQGYSSLSSSYAGSSVAGNAPGWRTRTAPGSGTGR